MKKAFAMAMILVFAASAAACGTQAQETKATEVSETRDVEATESVEIASAEEDGQNPAMNYIGSYAVGRANIDVSCEGKTDVKFLVTWGSSAFETTSWEMSGTFDESTRSVSYTNGTKTNIVFDENGGETDTVEYTDGTGTFTFQDGGRLIWQDDKENAAEDMVFLFGGGELPDDMDPVEDGVVIDYGTSSIYSGDDFEEAIALIRAEFDTWEGCEMHSIRYAGDECNSEENIKWLNELKEGQNYTQCMEFLTNFHSPVEGGGAWEPDMEFEDYQWYLGRSDTGSWELLSWGY